jgi:hypothetical protein
MNEPIVLIIITVIGFIIVTISIWRSNSSSGKRIENKLEKHAKTISSSGKKLEEDLGEHAKAIDAVRNELVEQNRQYTQQLKGYIDKLDTANSRLGEMGEKYSNILKLLSSSVEGFASALNTVQDFDGLRQWEQALVTASTPLHDVVVLQSQYNSENKALVSGALQVLTEWAQQHRRVEEMYKSTAAQLAEWQIQHSTALRQNSDMLRDQLGHLAQNTEVTRRVLGQLSESIDKDGTVRDELRTRIPSLVASLSDIAKDLHETQRQNHEAVNAVRDIAKPMAEMTKSVNIQVANMLDTIRQQTDNFYKVQTSVNQTVEVSNREFASNLNEFKINLSSITAKTNAQITKGLSQALQSLDNSANNFAEQLAKNLDGFKSALANALPGKIISIIQILMLAVIIVLLVVGLVRLR